MAAGHVRDAYPYPTSIPAGLSIAGHIQPLEEFRVWLDSLDIQTQNTRLWRYLKYLQWFSEGGRGLAEHIFVSPEVHPFRSPEDRFLYVIREVHELNWIFGGLRVKPPIGIRDKLKKVIGGTDFAALDRNTESRDTQFELRIASYFCRLKYSVDVSTETDIVASSLGQTFHVECKRVSSDRLVARRLKEANSQLQSRLPPSARHKGHFGIVALDVTKVAFQHNGLTAGVTAEHSRDVVREALTDIYGRIRGQRSVFPSDQNVLLWLQIHIPSLVNQPIQVLTHFSSYFVENPNLDHAGKRAFKRLQRVLEASRLDRSNDVESKSIRKRTSETLEVGAQLVPDEVLFRLFVLTGVLPPRDQASVALTVIDSQGESDFLYAELALVAEGLSDEEKLGLRQSYSDAVTGLAARLLLQRYAYEDAHGNRLISIPPPLFVD